MAKLFKVSAQGIENNISIANGSYDTIEIGDMTSDSLYEALQKFKAIKEIITQGNEDICPPSLYVEHDGKDYSFYLSGGEIVNLNTEVKMSPMEIVNMVSGFTSKKEVAEEALAEAVAEKKTQDAPVYQTGPGKRSVLAWGSDHPDIHGMQPVRKKELGPTDKEEWSGFNVDTKSQAQISAEVYKSGIAKGLPTVSFIFGIVAGVMALGLLGTGEVTAGLIFLIIAAGLFWLKGFLKKTGRGEFILGFDWKANAMWAKLKQEKRAIMIGNANCIAAIEIYEHTAKRPYTWNPSDSQMQRAVKQNQTDTVWILDAVMSNGERRFVFEFHDKKDAADVLNRAQNLLAQQN